MACRELLADGNSSSATLAPKNVMPVLPISMVIHLIHLALLLRVMAKSSPILKKPINWMILSDEVIRFLGSVGALHGTFALGMWSDPGKNINSDCDPSYCFYVQVAILGSFWNIIGGTGCYALS